MCFVTPEYFPISGGTGAYVFYLSHSLQQMGHHIHVVARDKQDSERTVNGIKVHYITGVGNALTRYWKFARSASKKIKELDEEIGIDIIHANLPLVPNFAIPKDSAKAIVCAVHSTWKGEAIVTKRDNPKELNPNEKAMLRFNSVLRSYEKKLMNRSDALIAVSKYTVNELTDLYGISTEKIHVIYNGVDIQKFKPRPNKIELRQQFGLEPDNKIVLFVGRLYHRKGLEPLLRSIPLVLKEFSNVTFAISGTGFKEKEESLRNLAKELNIEKDVKFLGYVPDEKLPELYSASDIFVLPAIYENFPFAILEAQSTALPVISTNVGGIPEFLEDRKNGFVIEAGDEPELTQKLLTLLQNPDLAKKMGDLGREMIEQKLSWNIITNQVIDLYHELLGTA
ncbi:MAG: glycosyltransferase family 4 protein [Candidatus Bathyarchaeota archaeon]|nr:glycosyltransferase family 4 protein [Candidatus Bathyarchaeum tardum]WGM90636.1 MAG: glycosyltransferase family 4 protein [Candidatus Bathyarchaeum tardum]